MRSNRLPWDISILHNSTSHTHMHRHTRRLKYCMRIYSTSTWKLQGPKIKTYWESCQKVMYKFICIKNITFYISLKTFQVMKRSKLFITFFLKQLEVSYRYVYCYSTHIPITCLRKPSAGLWGNTWTAKIIKSPSARKNTLYSSQQP